ncbi:Nif3-like dinuclear metal center hexameric protein [Mycobacterium sp. MYCO198283]|nr:Nif3-like dinuclear metal center hexameric protein [Mycobacterium sp. MYCO198283]MCG5432655.1 Nif3-like dinuclear metal center hexameric protein [Mycobacterium sp. MYCO198283]
MAVRLGEIIDVLEAAYPPALAQDWDSVGLVCGDPVETVDSVTVAVDPTAAVVDETGDRALLVAHHPLLLRGVDTVAADSPKGALVHRLLRRGSALFTAHTNADAAAPGVSDALAAALGLKVDGVLEPVASGPGLDKWVVYVPVPDADTVREAIFAAGAGHLGNYSHCSWSVTGTGQFLPHDGARPAIGEVGTVERVTEERVEAVAPAAARATVLAALRAAHPYEEPAFDIFPMAPIPSGAGIGRICSLPAPESFARFAARVHRSLPATSWGVRAAGDAAMPVRRVAVCGGAGDSLLSTVAGCGVDAYVTADLRHHPADEHRRGSAVGLVDVAHWASEQPWCAQAAAVLSDAFGAALPVRVSTVRTDPWNVEPCGVPHES